MPTLLRLGLTVVSLLALCAGTLARGSAAPEPYELNVIASLTGPIAFLGQEEQQTFEAMAALVNEHGGIQGRPLKFVVSDDQSSPVVAVQLATHLIQKGVPVILGPTLTATCAAIVPLIKESPLLYCLSPAIHPKRGSAIFSSSVTIYDDAMALLRYAHDRAWTKIGMITATDASGQEVDRAFGQAFANPENASVHLIDQQHFNTTDLGVDAQMAHIAANHPDAVIAWTTGTSFGTLLHGLHDTDISVPIIAGSGNMIKAQLARYGGFLPPELYFPGLFGMTRSTTAPKPVQEAQATYMTALAKAKLEPDMTSNIVWDYVMTLIGAIRHIGPSATAPQIREYIDGLRNEPGIEGMYTYTDPEQRGIGQNAVVIYRWTRASDAFVPASEPGGHTH